VVRFGELFYICRPRHTIGEDDAQIVPIQTGPLFYCMDDIWLFASQSVQAVEQGHLSDTVQGYASVYSRRHTAQTSLVGNAPCVNIEIFIS
jgi:hypothetical protein